MGAFRTCIRDGRDDAILRFRDESVSGAAETAHKGPELHLLLRVEQTAARTILF